MNLKSLDG